MRGNVGRGMRIMGLDLMEAEVQGVEIVEDIEGWAQSMIFEVVWILFRLS